MANIPLKNLKSCLKNLLSVERIFLFNKNGRFTLGKRSISPSLRVFVGDSKEVWIPSEKPTKNWTNEASEDFQTIRESPNCVDSDERKKKLSENFDGTIKTRIVFWRAEVCRFVGVYELDESDGDPYSRLWRRIAVEVSVPA
ncbi:MAG: hypothetical protein ACI4QA_03890 [Candidatus Spyradosoma sp.]